MASGMLGYYIGNEITIGGNKNWISGQTNFGTGDGEVSIGSGINGVGPYEFIQLSAMRDGVKVSHRTTIQLQWAKILKYAAIAVVVIIVFVVVVALLYFLGVAIVGVFKSVLTVALGIKAATALLSILILFFSQKDDEENKDISSNDTCNFSIA